MQPAAFTSKALQKNSQQYGGGALSALYLRFGVLSDFSLSYALQTAGRMDREVRDYIEERIYQAAAYIIENGATVRDAAKVLKNSKSTVHKVVKKWKDLSGGN